MSLADELRSLVGAENVLTAREACVAFECDGLSAYRHVPDVVALPANAAEVQQVMALCHRLRVPVVARGAGTGLSGGSLPVAGAVLLVLSRLNRILELSPRRRLARVQPGVTNLAISKACAEHGLFYAPDPSSQIACTIGGNVAENSGGVHCLKYGITLHNILEIKVVSAAGELLVLGSQMGDAPGYALTALLTGSEGMLGVIVEVTVKLLPRPERVELLLGAFSDIDACARVVGDIISAGIIPAGLEMMDGAAICAAEAFAKCGYPTDAQALLLCEIDGNDADVRDQLQRVTQVLREAGATYLRLAADSAEQLRMWSGRKAAFPAVGRLAPDYYCMDGTIPRRRLPEVLRLIAALASEFGLPIANVFHAGDGNLHPLIMFDAGKPEELTRAEECGSRILELCVAVGGTVTGEHGVGVEKLGPMCKQFSAAELQMFHAVKRAFDPCGLLNPGKAVPTLARCGDYGALRVHGAKQPFAHLPRF
ncbi:MAG TPA: FAD-linked oxidase C-terminal domain-containing protein [Steroidobacteraceae bacterium]